jgi:glycerate kinase
MPDLAQYSDLPGSGAAGGLGAALASLGAELVPGASTLLDQLGFDRALGSCDLVVTGEGQVDATTTQGKAPGEVARRAAAVGKRCVVFGGRVVTPVEGAETVRLSGSRKRAEDDLFELGRALGLD